MGSALSDTNSKHVFTFTNRLLVLLCMDASMQHALHLPLCSEERSSQVDVPMKWTSLAWSHLHVITHFVSVARRDPACRGTGFAFKLNHHHLQEASEPHQQEYIGKTTLVTQRLRHGEEAARVRPWLKLESCINSTTNCTQADAPYGHFFNTITRSTSV